MALPPRDQRHQYLIFEGLKYIDADITDFETRLGKIYKKEVHRVQVFDFGGLTDLMAEGLSGKMLMEHRDAQGQGEAMISGGQFVTCLVEHFGLITEERLQGRIVIVQDHPEIDMVELVAAAGVVEDAPVVDEGALAVPAPVQAHQPPPVVGPANTMEKRLGTLEEGVYGLRGAMGE
nr:hypothetical protein [Tanacetum cinerariifolium]